MARTPNQTFLPPTTPRSLKSSNEYVFYLNGHYPGLHLPIRSRQTSPADRASNQHNLCYDRINEHYWNDRNKLERAIASFELEVRQSGRHDIAMLLNYLPRLTTPATSRQFGQPALPVSSFPEQMAGGKPRATTPELSEDNYGTPPASPSPAIIRMQRSAGNTRKRPSSGADSGDRSRTKLSLEPQTPTRAQKHDNAIIHTSPLGPIPASAFAKENASFESALPHDISFGSTIPGDTDAAKVNVSFTTDITVTDVQEVSDLYPCSSFSWPTQDRALLDGEIPRNASSSRNLRHIASWAEKVPQESASEGTSLSSDTRRRMVDEVESILAPTSIVPHVKFMPTAKETSTVSPSKLPPPEVSPPKVSPTRAMQSLQLDESGTGSGFDRTETYLVKNWPAQNLFARDYHGPHVDFRILWESTRMIFGNKASVEDIVKQFEQHTYHEMLEFFLTDTKMPTKLSPEFAWKAATGECAKIQFTARLVLSAPKSRRLFDLELAPLVYSEQSGRFQRKFGNHRLLYLNIPDLDSLPNFSGQRLYLYQRFEEWLHSNCPKHFLGREWRVIQFEQSKGKKGRNPKSERPGFRAVMLATSGLGLDPISVPDAACWLIDLNDHRIQESGFRKTRSRIDLGFSKTEATLCFQPSQVIRVVDKLANGVAEATEFNDPDFDWPPQVTTDLDKIAMNDGCALISVGACELVWEKLGRSGPIPAAFQGRIGGAKGVWIRSGPVDSKDERDTDIWIQVSDSQCKFEPHEIDKDPNNVPDPHRWTFEVLTYTKKPAGADLHMDMIPILCDRGVPLRSIQKFMTNALEVQGNQLLSIFDDPIGVREWISENFGTEHKDRRAFDMQSPSVTEKVIFLLEHGFNLRETPYLADLYLKLAEVHFSRAFQSLKVPLPRSVNILGIADPLGVLQPGQIFLAFSEPFLDSETDDIYHYLDGKDVIVTRHPMLLPSNIQHVRTTYHPDLARLKLFDVVIFPSTGSVPLASQLQGGDYDGDKFIVCWEEALVENFQNAPPEPVPDISLEDFGIHKDTRKTRDVLVGPCPVENFLAEGFSARLHRVPLGLVTKMFKAIVYADRTYATKAAQKLALLYSYLIDADKCGHVYSEENFREWLKRDKDIHLKKPLEPEYEKAMKAGISAESDDKASTKELSLTHPNDVIFFQHIRPPIVRVLRILKEFVAQSGSEDRCLIRLYDENLLGQNLIVREEMKILRVKLNELYDDWISTWKNAKENAPKDGLLDRLRNKYAAIVPCNTSHNANALCMNGRLAGEPSTWDLVKASALYRYFHGKKNTSIIFQLAGRELGYMKAQSFTDSRLIVQPMWAIMKVRKRKNKTIPHRDEESTTRRLSGFDDAEEVAGDDVYNNEDDDAEEEQFYSADEA